MRVGTRTKTTTSTRRRRASERRNQTIPRHIMPAAASAIVVEPAVAETGIVLDLVERCVDRLELLPDPLDERPDVGPIADIAVAGNEPGPPGKIVDLAV